jgi:outer membrane lipoprotein SlyB
VLPGADNRRIRLTETNPGVYTAQYTVTDADHFNPEGDAMAVMRLGERRTDTTLPRALASLTPAGPSRWQAAQCATCGTVVAVNKLQVSGDAPPVGTVAGGVLGAVLGSQFGKGDGRTAAGVAGAVAGGVIGHQIDKRRNVREQYEVVVRMANGTQQTIHVDADPKLRSGDAVRVIDGRLQAGNA